MEIHNSTNLNSVLKNKKILVQNSILVHCSDYHKLLPVMTENTPP